MTRAEILRALQDSRAEFALAVAGVTDEQLQAPGVIAEGWSVKDLMAHVVAWEAVES